MYNTYVRHIYNFASLSVTYLREKKRKKIVAQSKKVFDLKKFGKGFTIVLCFWPAKAEKNRRKQRILEHKKRNNIV